MVEVLVYENSANRRMQYLQKIPIIEGTPYSISWLVGVYPGDSKDQDFSSSTNLVFVLPPTGANKSIIISVVLVALVVLSLTAIKLKKKIKGKNK